VTRAAIQNIQCDIEPSVHGERIDLSESILPSIGSAQTLSNEPDLSTISIWESPQYQSHQHLLNNEHSRARIEGIRQLIISGDESSIRIAMAIGLSDNEPHVRTATCQALKNTDLSITDEALITPLQDVDAKVRWSAADALSGTVNPKALASLINDGLADSVAEVRNSALKALLISQGTHKVLRNLDLSEVAKSKSPSA
jgi:hypothetical protein